MSWSSKDRHIGKYRISVTIPSGKDRGMYHTYFSSLKEAKKSYREKLTNLRNKAENQPQKIVAGLPESYHIELVLREASIDIGE